MKLARLPDGNPEIFHTLQGEGRSVGAPAVFVRSSLCNLHCRWCDTDYTWNWVGTNYAHDSDAIPGYQKYRREDQIINLPVETIAELASSHGCHRYVFTGGEPLLQEKDWTHLMRRLRELGGDSVFEIETNGTLFPGEDFLSLISQINVSPKLMNSGVAETLRCKPEVLKALAQTGLADFKFVIGSEDDLREVQQLVESHDLPKERIFLMPQARSPEELEARQGAVAEHARQLGFHYSDRLHLRLFGAKRGV